MNSSRLCGAKVASALFFVVLTLSPFSAFAVNPPAPFSPSDNVLDPGCLPTDSNCYVSISNLTLSNATTTNLSVLANALITGNVGIGTTTPSSKLSVVGDVLIGGSGGHWGSELIEQNTFTPANDLWTASYGITFVGDVPTYQSQINTYGTLEQAALSVVAGDSYRFEWTLQNVSDDAMTCWHSRGSFTPTNGTNHVDFISYFDSFIPSIMCSTSVGSFEIVNMSLKPWQPEGGNLELSGLIVGGGLNLASNNSIKGISLGFGSVDNNYFDIKYLGDGSGGNLKIRDKNGDSLLSFFSTYGYVSEDGYVPPTSQVSIGTTNFYNGRIGVGGVTPLSALDVSGGIAVGSYAGVSVAPSNGLIVSGNVGIGKSSPTVALDVNGSGIFSGDFTVGGGGIFGGDLTAGSITTTSVTGNNILAGGLQVAGVQGFSVLPVTNFDMAAVWDSPTLRQAHVMSFVSLSDIGISSSGQYQTVLEIGHKIYTSDDYGATWTPRDSDRLWYSVSISSSGEYQSAVERNGKIYISNDYGETWTPKDSDRNWYSVSISSSGEYQTAIESGGKIYISNDYGDTWTPKDSDRNWYSVSISSSGEYQVAQGYFSGFYVSQDYGQTWTFRDLSISGISISSSGQYQAGISGYYVQYSNDYGNTWSTGPYGYGLDNTAISSDGSRQVATYSNNQGGFILEASAPLVISTVNVGIGTTTPSSKLDLWGNLNVGTSSIPTLFADTSLSRVSIATTSSLYTLTVGNTLVSGVVARFENSTGYCDINPTTTSLTCTSDVNLKKNIVTLDASTTLANLNKLNAVTYNWKSEDNASSTHAGFIAQEVQPLFPDLVATDANGTLSVSYGGFIPYIIQSIKSIVGTIANFKDSFTTKNLCVGEGTEKTCITKEQLDTIIRQSGQTVTPQPVIPPVITDSNTTTDSATSTSVGDGVATTTEQVSGGTETASEQATTTPPLDTIAPPVTENNQDVAPSNTTQSNP